MSIFNYDVLRLNFSEVNLPIYGFTSNKERLIIDDGYSKNKHFYTITIEKNNHSQTKRFYQK